MRIGKKHIHIIESLKTGGAQRLISDLLPALKQEGIEVELIVACLEGNSLENKIIENGISIINLGTGSIRNINFYKRLRKHLKDNASEIRLLHAHLFPTLYIVPLANRGTGIPMVYTEHSTSNKRRTKRLLRPIEKIIYSRYDLLIGISKEVSEALSDWIGKKMSKKVVTITNGIDITKFQTSGKSSEKISKHERFILMVSRFVPAKNQETLIRCIPYVADPNVTFCFAGDGETLERHITQAKAMGLEDRCRFLGNVEDISTLMHNATIGVQSSHWEGFGLTAVEFMAAGVPVIATDIPGLGDIVRGAGLLAKPSDPKDMAIQINRLLSDGQKYVEMQKKGYERSLLFCITATAKKTAEEYAKIPLN